ncbi:MAG: hypothetical protein AABM64_14045 [Pseudomonadota bacterium]
MHRFVIRSLRTLACVALVALCTWTAHANVFADGDHVMLQAGPYAYHRYQDTEHNNLPWLIGVEWESASRWELGASYFENSFYQPSIYIYAGRRWFLRSADEGFYVKVTGGPLYGYKEPYEDKIPLNYRGFGLVVIPAIGYQYQRASAQLVIFGTAGLMLTFGYDFWK